MSSENEERDAILKRLLAKGQAAFQKVLEEECWACEAEFLSHTSYRGENVPRHLDWGDIFCLTYKGARYWPKFQIPPGHKTTPKDFDAVLALLKLRGHRQEGIFQFFTLPSGRWEGLTPMDLLVSGRLDDVFWCVRTYLEHGAT